MFRHLRVLPAVHAERRLVTSFGAPEAPSRCLAVDGRVPSAAMALKAALTVVGAAETSGRVSAAPFRQQPLRWHALKLSHGIAGAPSPKQWESGCTLPPRTPARHILRPSPPALLRYSFPAPRLAPSRALAGQESEGRVAQATGSQPDKGGVPPALDGGLEGQQHSPGVGTATSPPLTDFVVINFYKLTNVADPNACVQEHLDFIHVRARP